VGVVVERCWGHAGHGSTWALGARCAMSTASARPSLCGRGAVGGGGRVLKRPRPYGTPRLPHSLQRPRQLRRAVTLRPVSRCISSVNQLISQHARDMTHRPLRIPADHDPCHAQLVPAQSHELRHWLWRAWCRLCGLAVCPVEAR
jgi:hypothetical protein